MAEVGQQTGTATGDFDWSGQGDVPAALNRWIEPVADKDMFPDYQHFWSSSERSNPYARLWYLDFYGKVECDWYGKDSKVAVRPVLAF